MTSDLRGVLRHTGGQARWIALLLLRAPFEALRTLAQAAFLKAALDAVQQGDTARLGIVCAAFGACNLLLFLYNGTIWVIFDAFVARWVCGLRALLLRRVAALSLPQIEARPAGAWITRLNADVRKATALADKPLHLAHGAVAALQALVSSLVLLGVSPAALGLTWLFVAPHLLLTRLLARPVKDLSAGAQAAAAANASAMDALIACADTARLYDAHGLLLRRFEESSRALMRANLRVQRQGALSACLTPLLGLGGFLVLLLAGAGWIASGAMTLGGLMAVLQMRGGVIAGGMTLSACLVNIRSAMAGVTLLRQTLDMEAEEGL